VDAPVISQTRDFLVLMISDSSSAKGFPGKSAVIDSCLAECCEAV
jgi:hypothetical protein